MARPPSRSDRKREKKDSSSLTGTTTGDKSLTDLFAELEAGDFTSKQPPTAKFLEWFHRNVGVERDADLHHRIGSAPGEVARGNHRHDGKDSMPLWDASAIPADPAATTAALATWAAAVNDLLALKAG